MRLTLSLLVSTTVLLACSSEAPTESNDPAGSAGASSVPAAGAVGAPTAGTAGQTAATGGGAAGSNALPTAGGSPANSGGGQNIAPGATGTAEPEMAPPGEGSGDDDPGAGASGMTGEPLPADDDMPAADDDMPAADDDMPAADDDMPSDDDLPATDDDGAGVEAMDVGADEKFSFFVTSYHHIKELSGSEDGFGGDLRYGGAATGLEGADAICQEIGRRVSFGHRTWKAYLSTSTVNAIDRVGAGPWYDFAGELVAEDLAGLLVTKAAGGGFGGGGPGGGGGGGGLGLDGGCVTGETDRPAGTALDCGTYDELGLFHDGSTDQNNDGIVDDDHDTMTATLADGTYAGFSCEDWTSTTATAPEGRGGGILMGHSWPAGSGQHWADSHAGHACAAGTNFIQDGAGDAATVGGGGGYGGFYCFAAD